MLVLAAVLIVATPALPAPPPIPLGRAQQVERARDTGETMRRVDDLRARARYQEAQDELRGFLERWYANGFAGSESDFEFGRMMQLMSELTAIQEAYQRAATDPEAARRYLALLVNPAHPTGRTVEQARALQLLAGHDARARAFLDAIFPARLVIVVDGETPDPDLQAFPLESALVEMSRDALPLVRGAGASSLHLHVTVQENDRRNSILEGTGMRSYAMHMAGTVVGPDGSTLLTAAATRSALGINPGFAARSGMARCGETFYQTLVDEAAKRVATGEY